MPAQHLVREHGERVAGVEREPEPVLGGKRRSPAAQLAAVDDVVVDQERVVQQLDRDGDRARRPRRSPPNARHVARHSAGRIALPGRLGYVAHDAVEPAVRLAVGDGVEHRAANEAAGVLQDALDEVVGFDVDHGHASTTTSTGSHASASVR